MKKTLFPVTLACAFVSIAGLLLLMSFRPRPESEPAKPMESALAQPQSASTFPPPPPVSQTVPPVALQNQPGQVAQATAAPSPGKKSLPEPTANEPALARWRLGSDWGI